MKKLICFFSIVLLITSCSKVNVKPDEQKKIISNQKVSMISDDLRKYAYFACIVYFPDGGSCPGKRCGAPGGKDCRDKESDCHCLPSNKVVAPIFDNLTIEEFNKMWKDEKGREILKSKGVYSVDI